MTATIHALCFFLCHSLGVLYQKFGVALKNGCQIFSASIFAIPNFARCPALPYPPPPKKQIPH